MLAIDLAQRLHQVALLGQFRRSLGPPVDKIIEAGQLFQPDLTAELIETRDAALAVANDIERRNVDFAVETRPEIEVLQELRMIVQLQQP